MIHVAVEKGRNRDSGHHLFIRQPDNNGGCHAIK
jgi:hypothetical protein